MNIFFRKGKTIFVADSFFGGGVFFKQKGAGSRRRSFNHSNSNAAPAGGGKGVSL
jgi:hypothetical protein